MISNLLFTHFNMPSAFTQWANIEQTLTSQPDLVFVYRCHFTSDKSLFLSMVDESVPLTWH